MPLIGRSYSNREGMNLLASKLKHRCTIQRLEKQQNFSDDAFPGVYDAPPITEKYIDLKRVWCAVIPQSSLTDYISAVRGEQQFDRVTHTIWMRLESVKNLNVAFDSAFADGFDTVADVNPLKSDYYIVVHGKGYTGRRFHIVEIRLDEVNKEFIRVRCTEEEELGTGY